MDRIEKALKKFTEKERKTVKDILRMLKKGELSKLDIKKLKGRQDIYRVRRGGIRIIYRFDEAGEIFTLAIELRSEKTYKNF